MRMQDTTPLHHSSKWQNMLAIVNEHRGLIQNNLAKQNRRLFYTRLVTENIFIFLLQYTGLMLSTTSPGLHPVWIASGTACAFVFLRGVSILPGIWLGSFFAFYSTLQIIYAGFCASIFTLQPLLLLVIYYRYLKTPIPYFLNTHMFITFLLTSAIVTTVTTLLLFFIASNTLTYLTQLPYWWLANFNGIVIFTCAIITWDAYFSESVSQSKTEKTVTIVLFTLLTTLIIILGMSIQLVIITSLSIAIFTLTIAISYFLGILTSIASIALFAMLISVFSYVNTPLFFIHQHSSIVVMIQALISISAILSHITGIKAIRKAYSITN